MADTDENIPRRRATLSDDVAPAPSTDEAATAPADVVVAADAQNVTILADSAAVVERTEGEQISLKAAPPASNKVTVIVPRGFDLTLDDGNIIKIHPGVGELEFAYADHWYSRAIGVKIYQPE